MFSANPIGQKEHLTWKTSFENGMFSNGAFQIQDVPKTHFQMGFAQFRCPICQMGFVEYMLQHVEVYSTPFQKADLQ